MEQAMHPATAPDEHVGASVDREDAARRALVVAGAGYLGLEVSQLETRLEYGESMAEVAIHRGRSIQGLFDVLLVACRRRLPRDLPQETLLRAVERAIVGPGPPGRRPARPAVAR